MTFIPENVVLKLSDEEKLAELDEAIKAAKAAMVAAGDDEAIDAARTKAKKLKKERKALKVAIENKKEAGNNIDQTKIDELKTKIKEAKDRQVQAFDDDDDDAEEEAAAEVKLLTKQLRALTDGDSIPKQKLEDAKKKDASINS